MRYEIKTYSGSKILLIKDPYTKESLGAIDISFIEDKEHQSFIWSVMSFFPYYDFSKNPLKFEVVLTDIDGIDAGWTQVEIDYLVNNISTILDVPRTQALQLFYLGQLKGSVKVKSTSSFKEAYSIAYNFDISAIDVKVSIV